MHLSCRLVICLAGLLSFASPGLCRNVTTSHPLAEAESTSTSTLSTTTDVGSIQKADDIIRRSTQLINQLINQVSPFLMRMGSEVEISIDCMADMLRLLGGVRQMKEWAIRMLDATMKPSHGMLAVSFTMLGSFDECLAIDVTSERSKKQIMTGKYCLVRFDQPVSLMRPMEELKNITAIKNIKSTVFRLFSLWHALKDDEAESYGGVCVPSSCLEKDVSNIVNKGTELVGLSSKVKYCYTEDSLSRTTLSKAQLTSMCFISFLLVLSFLGTGTDLLIWFAKRNKTADKHKESKGFTRFLLAFSLYRNSLSFAKTDYINAEFSALNGMKVLSIGWIVLTHCYYFSSPTHFSRLANFDNYVTLQNDFTFSAILSVPLGVDTFFIIAGFLNIYTKWPRLVKSAGKMNFFVYFFQMVWRMLPAQMLLIGVLLLVPLIGRGPLWDVTFEPFVNTCSKMWWTNALFIQNFFSCRSMCFTHTWFLAILLHLQIIAFFIILILYRWPTLGVATSVVFIVAGSIATAVITTLKNIPPYFSLNYDDSPLVQDLCDWIHVQIYTHCAPYLIGLLLGYFLRQRPNLKLSSMAVAIFWTLASLSGFISVYCIYFLRERRWVTYPVASTVYSGLHRLAWSFAIGWIILASSKGFGGILNQFLSWKLFVPLERITFLVYLFHPIVLLYRVASTREKLNTYYTDMIYFFIGNLMLTVMLSFVIYIVFQEPMGYFQSLIFPRRSEKKKSVELNGKEAAPSDQIKVAISSL